ncbi:agmatine deiminase family protein [Woodsholea maritima]|uniref:agmatine deiminase family protein n=1 Tax=Woodsholea maritima TaxID=240237 RepID=UPI00036C0093|nr:agmatine deiminase family protein [Woodsholea maritima]
MPMSSLSLSRRDWLRASGALGLTLALSACQKKTSEPTDLRLSVEPEWARHEATLMTFCAAYSQFGEATTRALQEEQIRFARALAQFEPVTLFVAPDARERAQSLIEDASNITLIEAPAFDMWARDSLALIGFDAAGQRVGINTRFNVWGEKVPDEPGYDRDRALAEPVLQALDIPMEMAGIVCEAGALDVDGAGRLMTSETCLLSPSRNPYQGRKEVEAELKRLTGAEEILWLYGSDADTLSNGHVDGLARFLSDSAVMVEVTEDRSHPDYYALQDNLRRLRRYSADATRPLDVIEVQRPLREEMPQRAAYFIASYAKAYIANGAVMMPKYGDEVRDEAAKAVYARAFPDRQIVQMEVNAIGEVGGGLHDLTQVLPAPKG